MSNVALEERLQLARHNDQIRAFCERWQIVELAVFGSVLREDFTDESDIDVLIRPQDNVIYSLDDLLQMSETLSSILGRVVDLGTRRSVERDANYLRRHAILGSAQVLYEKR